MGKCPAKLCLTVQNLLAKLQELESCAANSKHWNSRLSMSFSLPTAHTGGDRPGFTLQGCPGVPGEAQLPPHSPCLLHSRGLQPGTRGSSIPLGHDIPASS